MRFMQLDWQAAKYIPRSRKWTWAEALIMLQRDIQDGGLLPISSYATMWKWTRKRVSGFIADLQSPEGWIPPQVGRSQSPNDSPNDSANEHKNAQGIRLITEGLEKNTNHLTTQLMNTKPVSKTRTSNKVEYNKEKTTDIYSPEGKKHALQTYIEENCPTLNKMKSPLTYDEAIKLLASVESMGLTKAILREVLDDMDNKPKITSAYKSTYKTALSWMRMRKNSSFRRNGKPTAEENEAEMQRVLDRVLAKEGEN